MMPNDRLVMVIVSHAQRLEHIPDIDRHSVPTIAAVAPRPATLPRSKTNPWEAALAELCTQSIIDRGPADQRLLDAMLASQRTTPDDLRALLKSRGLTDLQRRQVLMHRRTPGHMVIEYVCDDQSSTSTD